MADEAINPDPEFDGDEGYPAPAAEQVADDAREAADRKAANMAAGEQFEESDDTIVGPTPARRREDMLKPDAAPVKLAGATSDIYKEAAEAAIAERDELWRLFNRMDAAISHHKRSDRFKEDHDEALYAARDRIMRDAAKVGA